MKKVRVLILAGGGIYGCCITHFLSMLPEEQQNLNKIDVLSGASVGGLLASAYSIGHSFSYVDDVFQARAKDCFTKRCSAKVNPLACPTYRNDTIDKVMEDILGQKTMGDVHSYYKQLSLIIAALDLTNDKYLVFENITGKYNDVKLKDVSGMTAAAPTYFGCREFEGNCIVDSGLIEVVPILTATTEIKKKYGIPFRDMNVFVIGCGKDISEKKMTPEYYNSLGLLGIAKEVIVPYTTLSNEMFTRHIGANMGYNYFEYFNPICTNGKLDDFSQIPALVKEADKHKEEFLREWHYWLSL